MACQPIVVLAIFMWKAINTNGNSPQPITARDTKRISFVAPTFPIILGIQRSSMSCLNVRPLYLLNDRFDIVECFPSNFSHARLRQRSRQRSGIMYTMKQALTYCRSKALRDISQLLHVLRSTMCICSTHGWNTLSEQKCEMSLYGHADGQWCQETKSASPAAIQVMFDMRRNQNACTQIQ